jgi:hypothetical protein
MMNPRVGVPGVQPRSYPVPARKILPQAYEMFALLVSGSRSDMLSRPPWGCVATPSLALDCLGVSPQVLWSYTIRRQGPEIEKDAKRLYKNVGRRNLYRYEAVLAWLPGGEAYVDRPWHWSRCWLHSIGESVADDPEAVIRLIARLEETDLGVKGRPFGFRDLTKGLGRLRTAYGC